MTGEVRFAKPPVTEVVFSVSLALSRPIETPHIGAYWSEIRQDFPQIQDQFPLEPAQAAPPIAGVSGLTAHMSVNLLPPIRRVWFIASDGSDLIQIQDDRFIFNWRRHNRGNVYPGYNTVIQVFRKHFYNYIEYLAREGIHVVGFPVLELLYVNQIDKDNGLENTGYLGVMVDRHIPLHGTQRLPPPLVSTIVNIYPLPNGAGVLNIQSQARPDNVRVDLTARGVPQGADVADVADVIAWFDTAHEATVAGFVDATAVALQERDWGRES